MPDGRLPPAQPAPNWWRGATGVSSDNPRRAQAQALIEGQPDPTLPYREPTIRANTWGEWMRDRAHDAYTTLASTLPFQIGDKLGLTDMAGQAAAVDQPPGWKYGDVPLPGGKALQALKGRRGITAYHASPHDFDRFKLSSDTVGTGEGAQAFGHGLYFAGAEPTMEGYFNQFQRQVAEEGPITYQGVAHPAGSMRHRTLEDLLLHGREKVTKDLEANVAFNANRNFPPAEVQQWQDELAFARQADPAAVVLPRARRYEVDLQVDPRQLLDRDAQLYGQSPAAMRLGHSVAAAELLRITPEEFLAMPAAKQAKYLRRLPQEGHYNAALSDADEAIDNLLLPHLQPGEDRWWYRKQRPPVGWFDRLPPEVTQQLRDLQTARAKVSIRQAGAVVPTTGEELYEKLSDHPVTASRLLQESGVPGMRYLDQFSRIPVSVSSLEGQLADLHRMRALYGPTDTATAGILQKIAGVEQRLAAAKAATPSHNYVMFDDSLISILRKYGLLPPLAAGAVSGGRALDALRQPPDQDQIAAPPPAPPARGR